ncbi:MAG: helix-turn-helix domain-containing protein [Christensenellales bacterium]
MQFTTRFCEVLKTSPISQTQLAMELGITRQAITNLKSGISLPSLDLLCRICKALDVSADYLLGLSDY